MCILPTCISVHHLQDLCLWESEDGAGSPGTSVIDSCKLSCGCWELNLKVGTLLTAEPPFHTLVYFKTVSQCSLDWP